MVIINEYRQMSVYTYRCKTDFMNIPISIKGI
jgi:hypothetical protein